MLTDSPQPEPDCVSDAENRSNRLLTLPNAITMIRIVGSPGLIFLAWADQPLWLAVFAVTLVFTEWVDGFLARRMHATSAIGARLDTVADAVFYLALLIALIVLRPDLVWGEKYWMAAAIVSYWLSWGVSLVKFRHLPSYHTWAAKGVWVLIAAGAILLLADVTPWPLRVAMVCVAIANVEAICITLTLPQTRVDVPSLWHARRIANATSGPEGKEDGDAPVS